MLYYTRLVQSGRIAQLNAAALVVGVVAVVALAGQGSAPRVERYQGAGVQPITLEFDLPVSDAESTRIIETTHRSLDLLSEWLGPLAIDRLQLSADTRRPAGGTDAGRVGISPPWLPSAADLALERAVIASVAEQFWRHGSGKVSRGLAQYTALRAIHTLLDGRHFATIRAFGGTVPYSIRWISWSRRIQDRRPPYRWFPEVSQAADAGADRVAEAMYTLERYVGWPSTQQLLSVVRARVQDRDLTAADLATVATEQSGRDMSWLFEETFAASRFDYAVAALSSTRSGDGPLGYSTVVTVERRGDGIFSGGTSTAQDGSLRSLELETVFADGSKATDWIDGKLGSSIEYRSATPAVAASVDPQIVLLLDHERSNNVINLRPVTDPIGRRLTWHWLVWLQDLALTYAAIV